MELAFESQGDAGAPAVVCIHGLSGARTTWLDVAADLAADHHVFAVDLRGHGESPHTPGEYTVSNWSGDVEAFLAEVVGRPAVLVGHSLGGVVSADLAARRPDLVAAAFLEDPPLFLGDPAVFDSTIFAVLFPLMRDQFRELRARGATVDEHLADLELVPSLDGNGTLAGMLGPVAARHHAAADLAFDPEAMTAAVEGTALGDFDPARPVPPTVPVHVLRAEPHLGAAFRPEDEAPFLATNPHATVDLVPGASHLVHAQLPTDFHPRLRTFLAGVA